MAIPTWFNADFYMASKLAQLQETDPDGNWTAETMKAAFDEAGLTGVEGIYAHYDQYSLAEGTSPSQYLDADYYLAAKLAQMQKTDPSYTMDQLLAAFKDAGLTVGEHYELYGSAEGINPSAAFDQAKYMADKLAQLQAAEPDAEWTAAKVQEAFDAAGLTPLEHYLAYGKDEGLTPRPIVETFGFTANVDTLTGTDGNDTFSGVIGYLPGETTINQYDSVDGGAGTDTVVVNATSDVTVLKGVTAKSIEQLTINATYASVSDDVSGWADLEGITISGATAVSLNAGVKVKSLTLDGVDGAVAVTAANLASVSLSDMASADVTVAAASAASMNVNLDDVQGELALTGASIKTVILNSAGGEEVANELTLAATAATTLVISGDTDMAVSMAGATLATINAQSFTGDLDLTNVVVSTATNILTGSGDDDIKLVDSFAGKVFAGAGDDTVTLGTVVAASAVIDGGAGYDEIVTGVTGITAVDSSKTTADLFGAADATITNFEALTISAGSAVATVDFKGLDYDTVNVMAASVNMTVTFADGEDTLGLAGSMGTLTITGADASIDFLDTMTVATAVAAANTTTLDLNLAAAAAAVSIKSLEVKDGATITITDTGVEKTGSLEIEGVNAKGVTIDGSAVATATLDITGSDGADTIKGGAADDTLAGGAGTDVLYGGAGTNTFVFGANGTAAPVATDAFITGADTIMDWAEGTNNQIELTSSSVAAKADVSGQYSIDDKGIATFASGLNLNQMVDMMAAAVTNAAVAFTDGTDSYVFMGAGSTGLDASDILIKIAGVTDITDLGAILA